MCEHVTSMNLSPTRFRLYFCISCQNLYFIFIFCLFFLKYLSTRSEVVPVLLCMPPAVLFGSHSDAALEIFNDKKMRTCGCESIIRRGHDQQQNVDMNQ